MSSYSIHQHKHAFAAWAASTAARASAKYRFEVRSGRRLLERAKLNDLVDNPEALPVPDKFNVWHKLKRNEIVDLSSEISSSPMTHGVAAKLINTYLKAVFVCGGFHEHPKCKGLHPPIDRLLLQEMARVYKFQFNGVPLNWSMFDSQTYENVIEKIRTVLPPEKPLWMAEEYWRGYQ